MQQQITLGYNVEVSVWANPAPGVNLDDLIAELEASHTPILDIDRDNNRVLIHFQNKEEPTDGKQTG